MTSLSQRYMGHIPYVDPLPAWSLFIYDFPLETPKDLSEDPLSTGHIGLLLDILIDPQEAHID